MVDSSDLLPISHLFSPHLLISGCLFDLPRFVLISRLIFSLSLSLSLSLSISTMICLVCVCVCVYFLFSFSGLEFTSNRFVDHFLGSSCFLLSFFSLSSSWLDHFKVSIARCWRIFTTISWPHLFSSDMCVFVLSFLPAFRNLGQFFPWLVVC